MAFKAASVDAVDAAILKARKSAARPTLIVCKTEIGKGSPNRAGTSKAHGEALGAAFQVADDILDAEGTDEALGKRAGKDAGRNKATYVAAHGLDAAKAKRDALVVEALAALDDAGLGAEGDILRAAARFTAERKS